jgi:hypothetical protein
MRQRDVRAEEEMRHQSLAHQDERCLARAFGQFEPIVSIRVASDAAERFQVPTAFWRLLQYAVTRRIVRAVFSFFAFGQRHLVGREEERAAADPCGDGRRCAKPEWAGSTAGCAPRSSERSVRPTRETEHVVVHRG